MNEDKVEYVFDQHSSQPPQVITLTQERYEAAIAEARAEGVMEERHKCLADMCWMCGKNYPVHKVVVDDKVIWMHPRTRGGRYGAPCSANPIRLRWATKEH
jgi:hypothetical protein